MDFIPVIIIVIIVLLIRSQISNGKKKASAPSGGTFRNIRVNAAAWMEAAGELHCQYNRATETTPPFLSGELDDFTYRILPDFSEEKKLLYILEYPVPVKLRFGISNLVILDKELSEMQEFTGRKLFRVDEAVCAAEDRDSFQLLFSDPVRQKAVAELLQLTPFVQITNEKIIMEEPDVLVPDPALLRQMLGFAQMMYNNCETANTVPSAPSAPAPSAPAPAPAPVIPKPEPVPTPVPAIKPEPVIAPEPVVKPAAPVSSAEPGPNVSSAAEKMVNRLFAKSFPGKEEKDYFEKIKGSPVEWAGTLKSSYEFSSDFVFGSRKGVKATLEVCEIKSQYGSKQIVKAVVAFPPETAAHLKTQIGQRVRFRGILLKMEPFSRELYFSDGILQ